MAAFCSMSSPEQQPYQVALQHGCPADDASSQTVDRFLAAASQTYALGERMELAAEETKHIAYLLHYAGEEAEAYQQLRRVNEEHKVEIKLLRQNYNEDVEASSLAIMSIAEEKAQWEHEANALLEQVNKWEAIAQSSSQHCGDQHRAECPERHAEAESTTSRRRFFMPGNSMDVDQATIDYSG